MKLTLALYSYKTSFVNGWSTLNSLQNVDIFTSFVNVFLIPHPSTHRLSIQIYLDRGRSWDVDTMDSKHDVSHSGRGHFAGHFKINVSVTRNFARKNYFQSIVSIIGFLSREEMCFI